MADYIASITGADVFELIPSVPYPADYNQCGEVALAERDGNMRPGIRSLPSSLSGYRRIFIGYPIWWHTAPMIIGTFLNSFDLSGIDIYPFSQSASMDQAQFENSVGFVADNAPGAAVHEGLFARASDTAAIKAYISGIGHRE